MALLARVSKPSPERKALAEAIEAHAQWLAERQRQVQNGARLADARREAARAVHRAESALSNASAAVQDYGRRVAAGDDVSPPLTAAAARAALVEAQGAYELADEAHKAFQNASAPFDPTAGRLERAAVEVMRAEVADFAAALVSDVERLEIELVRKMSLVDFLDDVGVFPHGDASFGQAAFPADRRARAVLHRFDQLKALGGNDTYGTERGIVARNDGSEAWRAAHDSLLNDATTVLPVSA